MTDEGMVSPVELATEVTVAWLSNPNNRVHMDDVPAFIRTVHATLAELLGNDTGASDQQTTQENAETFTPAVSVRKSLASRDYILSMIDGKPYRTLRRHLAANGLTPEAYRERYNLKPDYPMVAEGYSEQRSALAKSLGLGRKPASGGTEGGGEESAKPRRARNA